MNLLTIFFITFTTLTILLKKETMKDKFITIAIRSYEHAQRLKEKLEKAGVNAFLYSIGQRQEIGRAHV